MEETRWNGASWHRHDVQKPENKTITLKLDKNKTKNAFKERRQAVF
jgi:hypothetical protein